MRKILRGHVFNKKYLFTLCLGLSFLLEAHSQVSGTFTINSAVATGGTNFQTFSAAVASLTGGVTGPVVFNVQAGSGPYNEQVIMNAISGTSATNTIIFNCNGVTLTFLSTNSTERAGVKLNGADYVTFDNLTVIPQADDYGEYAYGFHLLNNADHNTIKNCNVTNNIAGGDPITFEGIVINGNDENGIDPGYSYCDDNLIQGNTITGCGVGITLSSIPPASSPTQFINGNKILNNTISNFYSYGIEIYYTNNTVVDGNDFSGGPNTYYTYGINVGYFNESLAITNNRIHDFYVDGSIYGSFLYGIMFTSESVAGKECLISNNLIYNFQSNGPQYGIASQGKSPLNTFCVSYLNIYHNTISLDDQTVPGFLAETYGLFFQDASDLNVMNNIVSLSRPTDNTLYAIYFGPSAQRLNIDRNVYYIPPGTPPPGSKIAVGQYNGNPYYTLPAWQAAIQDDYFSYNVNPAFANPASSDFRPTAQVIDNMARYVNINTDITNAARNTTNPDVGCLEFTSPACSAPITAGSAFVLPDSAMCLGPTTSMGLKGNSAGGGQTYTWQTSSTATGGYTNVTGALGYPYYEVAPTTTLYYRVAITCGATTTYSTPVRVLVTAPLNAGTYTINSALPTGGINFTSFADAMKALECGINGSIVFNVTSGSGPYNEQVIIPPLNTSPARTVTFNCNGVTLAYAPTTTNQSAVLKLDGADYLTFDSLNVNVNGPGTYGFGIQLINDADHNTIKRCTINLSKTSVSANNAGIVINSRRDDPRNAVYDSYCDSNLVANNTVNGGYYGICNASLADYVGVSSSVGNIFRKNTLKDNCGAGIFLAGAGEAVIDSNDISHPTRTVFPTSPFYGIHVFNDNYGLTITKNRIHDLLARVPSSIVQLEGIKFERTEATPTQPNVVTNNVLYNFKGNGLQHGLYTLLSNYLKFYHNTVSLEDSASNPTTNTRGFAAFGLQSTNGVELINNSIVVHRGGTTSSNRYCVYIDYADSNLVARNNNYYNATLGSNSFTGYMGGVKYATLANWQATRKDSASIAVDPVYYDIANGDLTPTKIPFENRGTNVGITNDIWNTTRNTAAPDIGAIEFTICRTLTTPVLVADSAGVNAIKFSWTAVQNTTGYRVSRDGVNWTIPSSGAFGTSHIISGLKPADTVGLMVKALGSRIDCPEYYSMRLVARTLTDGIFIPNTFTPNGNGQNEVFKVYTKVMKSIRWMVFNQWGEKVFETSDLEGKWDGTYKGKPQPIGVYVYVVSGVLSDGTKVTQKGTFNLIR